MGTIYNRKAILEEIFSSAVECILADGSGEGVAVHLAMASRIGAIGNEKIAANQRRMGHFSDGVFLTVEGGEAKIHIAGNGDSSCYQGDDGEFYLKGLFVLVWKQGCWLQRGPWESTIKRVLLDLYKATSKKLIESDSLSLGENEAMANEWHIDTWIYWDKKNGQAI